MLDPYSQEIEDRDDQSSGGKGLTLSGGGLKKNISAASKISFDPPQFHMTGPVYSGGWVGATGGNRDFNHTSNKELLNTQEVK